MHDSTDAVFASIDGSDASVMILQIDVSEPDSVPVDPAIAARRAALEADLEQCASSLTDDGLEAGRLVDLTLAKIDEDSRNGVEPPEGRVALFRMLRQTYHSVERTRIRRAARPASPAAASAAPAGADAQTDVDADADLVEDNG